MILDVQRVDHEVAHAQKGSFNRILGCLQHVSISRQVAVVAEAACDPCFKSRSSNRASCHLPAFSQALIVALNAISFGICSTISCSSNQQPICHMRLFSHAVMVEL